MRLLLDTHAFIWWSDADARMSAEMRETVREADEVFVSIASAWEIAIKVSLGRLVFSETFDVALTISHFEPLAIEVRHTEKIKTLPLHHRDPFDRMLVAQGLVEDLILVTADRRLEAYGSSALWL